MSLQNDEAIIYKNPALLLQKLIRFNTTNPPGNEADCIHYISNLLQQAGIDTLILGQKPERPNLVARLKGNENAPPFLMYGHVDVVTTAGQEWKYPPFDGVMAEGCIWGRGALDMKGAVAMMVCSLLRAKAEGFTPKGDIILVVVSDEEDTGNMGARYLVEQHGDLFKGVRYAIGELGGFSMYIAGKKFYPIMVSEKQKCCLRAIVKGPGGHGSMPVRNGAMAKLSRILGRLNSGRLPVHVTAPAEKMIRTLAANIPFPQNLVIRSLLNPILTDKVLDILGDNGLIFDPILHNMVNATIVRGGDKINVIPSEIILEFDGRILPGFGPDEIINELKSLIGTESDIELTFFDPGPENLDMGLFDTLEQVLNTFDKEAIPLPFIISAVTDARFFARLGIQTYGFIPMSLPKDFNFSKLIHSADERVPVDALEFGVNAVYDLLKRL